MRVRRGLLFAGLFLIPVGAITLLVRNGTLDPGAFGDIWRFWPLILIGFGIALLLGRSRLALVGTAVAALVLGILVGGAIASGSGWIGSFSGCGASSADSERLDRTGTFASGAAIDLRLRCGAVDLTTTPGDAWALKAAYAGTPPVVTESPDRLEVRVPDGSGVRHNEWTVNAPTGPLRSVRIESNAATATLTLAGADLDRVTADANAGDILVDGRGATIDTIEVDINAGRARVALDGSVGGRLGVNAGAIDLCVPADASLRLQVNDQLTFVTNLAERGLTQAGTTWTRTGTGTATIDLVVEGNAASFTLDPDGGCDG